MEKNLIFEQIQKDNVKFLQLQFTDLHGIVKSVTIPERHLAESLEYGTWFDGSSIVGFSRIYESDLFLKPDLSTYAVIPWLSSDDGNTARFICDIYNPEGYPFEGDPRHILKKTIAEISEMGYKYNTGPEMEFFLFVKNNGVKPSPHDFGGYFDLTTDQAYDIRRDMTNALEHFGIDVETSHHEVARGQHEIDFRFNDALITADSAVTLRFVLKAIAQKNGLHATFMPKPITGINGSGMHVHQSLFDIRNDQNVFFDENDRYMLSRTAYNFIAGQLKHVKGMSAVLSPTVNSYKRLIPGYEAPVYISWARNNRSALIRIPRFSKSKSRSTRLELRCPDPSCNIYLAFAVMLKAGIDGIKNDLMPPDPVEEDVYHFNEKKLDRLGIDTLPFSLREALGELEKDEVIKSALGEHTFRQYVESKKREWDEFRLVVTNWELERYLETY